MNILFVHTNFPAQFRYLAEGLAADPSHRVAAIGSQTASGLRGVRLERYHFHDVGHTAVHSFARRFDAEARRAEQVLYALIGLESSGFTPDVIIAHSGWGETLPLRATFPHARLIVYCEYFYRERGQDVHFDPEFPRLGVDGLTYLRAKNASQLLALAECDLGVSPTQWQRSTYPSEFQSKIAVAHEGIDTESVRPDPRAAFRLPSGLAVTAQTEILTFVARNLEPMRGYHTFMRALPEILRVRPNAHVIIAGGDGVSYGPPSPDGRSWKDVFLSEVTGRLDRHRVHFVGPLPYASYLQLLQVSRVHVYLTYPFVLSWSLIEALSAGCLVVGSETAPVQEVITNGQNGLLVPFFEPRSLAAVVIAALAEPQRYAAVRQRARDSAISGFERRRAAAAQLTLLQSALGGPGSDLRSA